MLYKKECSWHQTAIFVLCLLLAGTYLVLSVTIKNEELQPPVGSVSVSYFTDVTSGTYDAIVTSDLQQRGIFSGYPDGSFGLQKSLNRAEIAKILVQAVALSPIHGSATIPFKDVDATAWYADSVSTVRSHGIVNGYPDGTYKPASNISRIEFMKMLSEAFALQKNVGYTYRDVNGAAWYAQYLGWYEQQGIFFPPILLPERPITRLEAARAMYAAIQLSPVLRSQPNTTSPVQPQYPVVPVPEYFPNTAQPESYNNMYNPTSATTVPVSNNSFDSMDFNDLSDIDPFQNSLTDPFSNTSAQASSISTFSSSSANADLEDFDMDFDMNDFNFDFNF